MAVDDCNKEEDEPFAEVDPTGRYGRYDELLGAGSVKKVYRGFDQEEGREIAWCKVDLRMFKDDEVMKKRMYNEVLLYQYLNNVNVLTLFSKWRTNNTVNFITELCTSSLRDYAKKHRGVSITAIKKWCRQILRGLEYLHKQEPCIIHRDLTCSNILVNGETGEIKIADFGFAKMVGEDRVAHSVLGTPEFMAPEIYEGRYTDAVDIYAFGMCLLELVTLELPYMECDSLVKIYKKVTNGVKPKALDKVRNLEVKGLIMRCLAGQNERPSATELLQDSFFDGLDDDDDENHVKTQALCTPPVAHCKLAMAEEISLNGMLKTGLVTRVGS